MNTECLNLSATGVSISSSTLMAFTQHIQSHMFELAVNPETKG